ncbi:hypothetical protein WA026_013828 [Henosepilachna vigintioctopunctata]|uniref:BUD13 homolog n=1 Tax=Henosepilachna vigintioctopunctata TaxID=420089 RepID=A0AAW1UZQ1_9CUCU
MSVINQKEYLKRYLKNGKSISGEKRKKKKKAKNGTSGLRIIDDNDDTFNSAVHEDLLGETEDAPQIVEVIDDRPPSLRIDEKSKSHLWIPIGSHTEIACEDTSPPIRKVDKDMSPPRRKLNENVSSPGKRIDEDISPPRRNVDQNISVPKKKMDRDISPPRKKLYEDMSPSRQDCDMSPPRRNRKIRIGEDISPPRRNVDQNISVPKRKMDRDMSPPRRNVDQNISVPKRKMDRDMSPPRKKLHGDMSPPRKKGHEDVTPSRQDCDMSPPRRNRKIRDRSLEEMQIKNNKEESFRKYKSKLSKHSRWDSGHSNPSKIKTLDGKSAGLQNAKDLVAEIEEIKRREDEHFKNLSNEVSGANANTIVRDRKTGKIRNFVEEAEKNLEMLKKKAENEEKYSRWGRGLKQVEDAMEKKAEALNEMNKPLARYADDDDLERYLKEQEREGDPMLAYIRKKKKKQDIDEGKPIKPEYMGEFMPNRFGIRPGHRWDGVNRSNGYEKRWFEVQNSRVAEREESYKWNTEDM